MFDVLQILSVVLAALVTTTTLAHALELPGKLRLSRDEYLAVQPIYYPGFTSVGFAEFVAPVATAVLLLLTPRKGSAFWWRLVALLGLVGVHAVYWIVTHPVNKFWLRDTLQQEPESQQGFATRFFSSDPAHALRQGGETRPADWTALRDRWEYSHVARAVLALVSLTALVIAITRQDGRRN